jgi:hypothetical protein
MMAQTTVEITLGLQAEALRVPLANAQSIALEEKEGQATYSEFCRAARVGATWNSGQLSL